MTGIREALKLFGKMSKEEVRREFSKPGSKVIEDYNYDEFVKDTEMIFKSTGGPKLVMCTICGETVTVPDDC